MLRFFLRFSGYSLLVFFCISETLCFTTLQTFADYRIKNAVIYFISGVAICGLSMALSVSNQNTKRVDPNPGFISKWLKAAIGLGSFCYLAGVLFDFGLIQFSLYPLDHRVADMLPVIKTACERWIHGQAVYTPVMEIWGATGGTNISYLPAMWMPYAPFIIAGLDLRWATIAAALAIVAVILKPLSGLKFWKFTIVSIVVLQLLYLFFSFYTIQENSVFIITEEMVPAFYYVFLMLAIMYENDFLTGVLIAMCVLSRFSIIPFLPFLCCWFFMIGKRARLAKILLVMGVTIVIMFFPFFIQQPLFFLEIPFKYAGNATAFWDRCNYTLMDMRDLGMAYVFGYEARNLINVYGYPLLIATPLLWLIAAKLVKRKFYTNDKIWLMAGCKLSLCIFYNFISMPALYLFVIPTLVSYPLFLAVIRETEL